MKILRLLFLLSFTVLLSKEPISPLPEKIKKASDAAKLGEKLFFDTSLSKDSTISCATCHPLELGGVDNLQFSFGVDGTMGSINTPTVFNSKYNFTQFWDGRSRTLEEQIEGPVLNPVEMASDWESVINKLNKNKEYVTLFKKIYQDDIKKEYIKNAIAEYERTLITPSRFDRFLRGQTDAITKKEKKGYKLFKEYGCVACHQGKNIGGNMYEKLGVFEPYFSEDEISDVDKGRYNITKNPINMYEFKVPSLRNIILTKPYFHDGSVQTIEEAVRLMAKHQLGRDMPKEHIDKIVAFFYSLTWEKLENK